MAGIVFRFLVHWLKARGKFRVHSPFAYDFVTKVLPHRNSELGAVIEALRRERRRDKSSSIKFEDYGAGYGGKQVGMQVKTMSEVVKSSARRRREGELLYRICQHYQPKVCLELGGNIGFSTLYQAAALKDSNFVSVEGAQPLQDLAQENYAKTGFPVRIRQEAGEFGQVLDRLLDGEGLRPDYVLIDGNHRYAPTMEYFSKLLPCMKDGGLMVMDDINWSAEMRKAWKEICAHPEVSLSIDLFFLGIVFIRRRQRKQHFRFRFRP